LRIAALVIFNENNSPFLSQTQLFSRLMINCEMTDEGCSAMTSALKSNPSHLRELKLSGNKLGDSGVKNLSDLLMNTQCKLEKLELVSLYSTKQCLILTSALKSNPSHLRELNLSGNPIKNTGVNHLCDVLKDSHCKLERLRCSITEKQCLILTSALKSNPSHLRELELSWNPIKNTGVNHLCDCDFSHFSQCRLSNCEMTDEGCSAMTSALKSNPSHLRELKLSGNKLGDSGVKNLSDLLMNTQCKLEKLELVSLYSTAVTVRLVYCSVYFQCFVALPANMEKIKGLNEICAVSHDYLCRCSITEKQCLILTSALKSNPSHLRELKLSGNKLGDSGVKNLSDLLMNTQCKLEKLELVSLYSTAVTVRLKITVYFHKVTMKLKLTVIIFYEYCSAEIIYPCT
uniref:Uncharacterized protein n=1 Tax=Sinocyclocheilus anshuiensis TaxID=1608454 RepID=A0A671KF57_9TELE